MPACRSRDRSGRRCRNSQRAKRGPGPPNDRDRAHRFRPSHARCCARRRTRRAACRADTCPAPGRRRREAVTRTAPQQQRRARSREAAIFMTLLQNRGLISRPTAFRLARPAAKSLPIMLSMFMNRPITFIMREAEPYIAQVTTVPSPFGSRVNSAVLWPSNGLMKSSLISDLAGGVGLGDLHPPLADVLVAVPFIDGALAAGGTAEGPLHRRILLFVGRPAGSSCAGR